MRSLPFLLLLTIVGLFFQLNHLNGQCPTSITLTTQSEIDNFTTDYPDCVTQGWVENLYITDYNGSITDLSPLYVIDSIGNYLRIWGTDIISLNSWNNLEGVKSLDIQDNNNLLDITGFGSLDSLDYLSLYRNTSLINIAGLQNLEDLEQLDIIGNSTLSTINGFNNLLKTRSVRISDNPALININGFNNIIEASDITIINLNLASINGFNNIQKVTSGLFLKNDVPITVTGFSNLEDAQNLTLEVKHTDLSFISSLKVISGTLFIRFNSLLTDISFIDNLLYIGNLWVTNNHNLSNCCVIRQLQNSNILAGSLTVNDNMLGCSSFIDLVNTCPDTDKDGIFDFEDNCPNNANKEQEDSDLDGIGNGCDNCPLVQNANQQDLNSNGIGDICETLGQTTYGIYNEQGDTYISDFTKGMILKAPNGDCYRIRVNNSGTLETYEVNCPQ